MAIKVTTGQQTFVKKIVVGTPITTAQTGLSIDDFSDFKVATKSEGQILVYDSQEAAFKNYDFNVGNALAKEFTPGTDKLLIQIDSDLQPVVSGISSKGHLLPATDSTYDLGDSALKWRDLHLSGGTIHLGGISLKDSGGDFGAKDSTGSPVNIDLQGSISQIRQMFTSGGDLSYNNSTGQFSFDVEQVYTKENFDSDFNLTLDSAVLEGIGLTYNNATNTLSIDSAELRDHFRQDIRGYINVADNGGDGSFAYDSAKGQVQYTGPSSSEVRAHFSGGVGIADSVNGNGIIKIDSSELTSFFRQHIRGFINAVDAGGDGSFAYDSALGKLTYTGPSASEVRAHFTGDKGLTYDNSTGIFSVDSSNLRTIISASDAGGDGSFAYNSGTGVFTYTGPSASEVRAHFSGGDGIGLSSGVIRIDSSELASLYRQTIRGYVSASGDLSYDAATGVFSFDVEDVYTKANFDSDFNVAIDSATTNDLSEGSNNLYYTTARADSDAKASLLGGTGVTYDSGTGVIAIGQAVATTDNVTFNQVRGPAEFIIDPATVGDATGTVKIMGNLQVEGTQTVINSTTVSINDKNIVIADSAADSSALDAGGITWGGSSVLNKPTFTYSHSNARFAANRSIAADIVGDVTGTVSSIANHNTGALSEGSNLYYTTARADSDAKASLLAIDAGGDGSFTYDSATGVMTYTGPSASEVRAHFTGGNGIALSSGDIKIDSSELTSLYRQTIRGYVSAAGDLTYNAATGQFSIDVEQVYTQDNFNSDFNTAIDSAALGGTGLTYTSGTNTLSITATGVDSGIYGSSTQVPQLTINTRGQIDSAGLITIAGVTGIVYDSASGLITVQTTGGNFSDSINLNAFSTTNLSEGTNKYYTNARVDSNIKNSGAALIDDAKITFGNDSDLKIYHNGSHSIIEDAGTGSLLLRSNNLTVQNAAGAESQITALSGGAVTLYHNNNARLATSDSGVSVTGELTADSATIGGLRFPKADGSTNHVLKTDGSGNLSFASVMAISGNLDSAQVMAVIDSEFGNMTNMDFPDGDSSLSGAKLTFGNDSDLRIYHDGSHSFISDQGTGQLRILSNTAKIRNADDDKDYAVFQNGAVKLYEQGNVKLETLDSGVNITGNLRVNHAPFSSGITVQEEGSALSTAGTILNFVGTAVTATGSGATKTITITGGTDSSAIIAMIDSDYVQARTGAGSVGTVNNVKADAFNGDNSTKSFVLSHTPADSDDVLVFVNGVLQNTNTYSLSGQTITLDSAPDSSSEIEMRTHMIKNIEYTLRDYKSYIYSLSSTMDSVSGADSSGATLSYQAGFVDVYLNGARLATGKDYTAANGTQIVFDSALGSGNIVEVVSHQKAVVTTADGIVTIDSDLSTADSAQVIDTFSKTTYRTTKYTAQLVKDEDSSSYHSEEILLTHNGTSVAMTTYAQVLLDSNLGTFDAKVNGSNIQLTLSPTRTNVHVKLKAIRTEA